MTTYVDVEGMRSAARDNDTPSFIPSARVSTGQRELANKLEVLKFIINTKVAEDDAAKDRLARRNKRAQLLELLENKEQAAMGALSVEQIKAELAAIDDE